MALVQITSPLHGGSAVALGLFDGVHIGHQAVLTAAVKTAQTEGLLPCAFTFASAALPVKQGRRLQYLYTEEQKDRLLEACGIQYVYRPDFKQLQSMDGAAFCQEILCRQMQAKAVFCGRDFRFGAGAAWDFSALCAFGNTYGFTVHAIEPVTLDGTVVSSTAIRNQLAEGLPEHSAAMLGQPYRMCSVVAHGQEIGRTIDFPTINQPFSEGQLVPKYGVYVSRVTTPSGIYTGVTNIGVKPTIDRTERYPLAETHLLDFTGNLYGTMCEVELLHYLRNEQKFESLAALQAAIAADCETARVLTMSH